MQASLVRESGEILCREKITTPRTGGPEQVVPAIEKVIADAIKKGGIKIDELAAIGTAVPGVVDPDRGLVVVAPSDAAEAFVLVKVAEGPGANAHGREKALAA